jgi:hypothetical protein
MAVPLHVGDVGAVLSVTVMEDGSARDMSTATVKQFKIRKPDGTLLTVSADLGTDGTDGTLVYVVAEGDLDAAGIYTVRAYFAAGAFAGHTTRAPFTVKAIEA